MTAYFGFFDVGKPKAGEVLVVSGAAGATGQYLSNPLGACTCAKPFQ